MTRQPESKLSYQIIQAIRARGGYAHKNHGGPLMPAGLPDISAVYLGYSVWFETKMPAGKPPTAVQINYHTKLRKAGAVVAVVRSVSEAVAVLDRLRLQRTA